MATKCVFCNIIAGTIPANIVAQNDQVLVIEDIAPKAPIHYLIIPKKHIQDVASLEDNDADYASALLFMARDLSKNLTGSQSFRLITNNGSDAGQSVFHMHVHFLSGKKWLDF